MGKMLKGFNNLLPGARRSQKNERVAVPTSTPLSGAESEFHPSESPLPLSQLSRPTDDVYTRTDHEVSHASDVNLLTVHSPLPTPAEEHFRTDRGPIVTKTHPGRRFKMGGANSQTIQGSSRAGKKQPAMENSEIETNDIVIAVMGPTGSGKSTFIRCVSGHETQGIGHTLKSFTSEVHEFRFWDRESGRYIVLVDTPGFDDTYKSDLDILNMISDWLTSSYNNDKLLSGILYLHRITDNRMAGTPLKNLRVFRKLCGKDALEKVYLTTTMWDEVEPNDGEKRLDELCTEYWKAMITQGAHIARCRSDDDSPKKLIRRILAQGGARKVLLQEEMVELGKVLKETSAGKQLYCQLEELVARQTELLRRIDKERKAAAEPRALADLRTEYDDLRAQIDEKLRQMEELKLPWLTRFLHHLWPRPH